MDIRFYKRGTVTIFLSIVMSGIFLLTAIFTDAARLTLVNAQVQRANKQSLSSVLAFYNNELKNEYGLFGVSLTNDDINEIFDEFLRKNLNIEDGKYLYDIQPEKYNIIQAYNLENTSVFEGQIMEYMKYRAPYEIANDLMAKIQGIKNISGSAKVCKRKLETDKKASMLGGFQLQLEGKIKKINNSELITKLKDLKEKYICENSKLNELKAKLTDLQKQYSSTLEATMKEKLQAQINSLIEDIKSASKSTQAIQSSICECTQGFKNLYSDALECAKSISGQKTDLLNKIQEELTYTVANNDGVTELQNAYQDSLNKMKADIAEDNVDTIISKIENSIANCNKLSLGSTEQDYSSTIDKIIQTGSFNYSFSKAIPAESDDSDNRSSAMNAVNSVLSYNGQLKYIDSSLLKQLPSRKGELFKGDEAQWSSSDFSAETGEQKGLNYLAEKEDGLSRIAASITEELFLNEYIMGTFRHDVPLLKGEKENSAFNLRSKDKTKRDGYFTKYEVEYIINGDYSEAVNSIMTKAEILAIRFVANIAHIYTDPSKMSRVTSLAASLSSWSAGLSTPLIQTALIFAWAMFESIYDVNQLSEGNKIILFKTANEWKTDISGSTSTKVTDTSKNNPLYLSYQDYLRILLLLTDKQKEIRRTQDLIQLNMGVSSQGFTLENIGVCYKVNTQVSIKNLFIGFPFLKGTPRSGIKRSFINKNLMLGY